MNSISRRRYQTGSIRDDKDRKWKNGTPSYEAVDGQIDEDSSSIGNSFNLSFAEEQTILNLIVDKPAEHEQACANCGKPYRAHLLHDRNKCGLDGDAAWFPQSIAAALEPKP